MANIYSSYVHILYRVISASLIVTIFALISACAYSPEYGEKDELSKNAIERINFISALRASNDYKSLTKYLEADLEKYKNDRFSTLRIYNELADLYSYQLGDMEVAIELDRKISSIKHNDMPNESSIRPKATVARNRILGDFSYFEEYVEIPSAEISIKSKERLKRNLMLLDGDRPALSKVYSYRELKEHSNTVKNDISNTISKGKVYQKLLSRLIKSEYELGKVRATDYTSSKYFLDGSIDLNELDLSEIDFLSLADYFSSVYRATNNLLFANLALKTIYKPYVNIRDHKKRWKYNKLVNKYISALVEGSYRQNKYLDMLYYASLNKSRMLFEERSALIRGYEEGLSLIEMEAADGLKSDFFGLPSKAEFENKIRSVEGFIDFYIDGLYEVKKKERKLVDNNYDGVLTTRDFGIEAVSDLTESYTDSALYVSYVVNGNVLRAQKLSGRALDRLKKELDLSYASLSKNKNAVRSTTLRDMGKVLKGIENPVVITDKWLSQHPVEYHLGGDFIRSVNAFALANPERMKTIKVAGFFNPTLDLPGSEEEASRVSKYIEDADLYLREKATKARLLNRGSYNIVHFSMHGAYNQKDPNRSKLYFNGAERGLKSGDPNALYAYEMNKFELLKERDLIFAAACQTGLVSADLDNQSELIGILRPLMVNRNKNVILSLWKVDDAATKYFVDQFYMNLVKIRKVQSAFNRARVATRDKYQSPYYWSAFYLSSFN